MRIRVCEGSRSEQAILRIALVEPQPVTRKLACHAIAGSKQISQHRAGDEGPGSDYPIESADCEREKKHDDEHVAHYSLTG